MFSSNLITLGLKEKLKPEIESAVNLPKSLNRASSEAFEVSSLKFQSYDEQAQSICLLVPALQLELIGGYIAPHHPLIAISFMAAGAMMIPYGIKDGLESARYNREAKSISEAERPNQELKPLDSTLTLS